MWYNETMSIDVNVAFINVHQPATWDKRKYNINGVVALIRNNGVGALNEFGKSTDHQYLQSLKSQGIYSHIHGELALLWDARRFDLVEKHTYRIMVGGHVGADGTRAGPDNRRVGPSRFLIVVVLRDRKTGEVFVAGTTHLVARADTAHKWRRGIRWASVKVSGLRLAQLAKKYPNGFLIGDMNWVGPRINWPYLNEVQLPLLRTHGNQKYDRAYKWGQAKLVPGTLKTFVRKSDHKGIKFTIRFGDGVPVDVPPVSHTDGQGGIKPGPKIGRWERWARSLSPRWKRQHPRRWRRIKARLKRLQRRRRS